MLSIVRSLLPDNDYELYEYALYSYANNPPFNHHHLRETFWAPLGAPCSCLSQTPFALLMTLIITCHQ